MVEFLLKLMEDYGYWVVCLGALMEGEAIIITASAAAALGKFDLWKIMVIAFFGSLGSDQILFYVGYFYGKSILDKYPKLRSKAKKVFFYIERYQTLFILGFRFLYAVRVITPIAIGMSNITPKKFLIINAIAALLWTIITCLVGYFFGEGLKFIFSKLSNFGPIKWLIILVIVVGIIMLIKKIKKKIKSPLSSDEIKTRD